MNYLSDARLSAYRKAATSEQNAIELHNETMLIGSALLAVLAIIEIALRNRLHQQVGEDFGTERWLLSAPCPVPLQNSETNLISEATRQAKRDRYGKLTNAEKRALDQQAYPRGVPESIRHVTLSRKRQDVITVTEGEVVAHTTIFFWKRFFAPEYEPTLWKRSVKKLFPNKTINRSDVSDQMEILYRTRNRLAHHEPVYGERLTSAMKAVSFVRENMDVRVPSSNGPICQLTEIQYRNLLERHAAFEDAWRRLTSE